jgi:hypothetical protein
MGGPSHEAGGAQRDQDISNKVRQYIETAGVNVDGNYRQAPENLGHACCDTLHTLLTFLIRFVCFAGHRRRRHLH